MKDNYYTLVVDADTIIYRMSSFLEENYIEVEYQNNGRKKKFKNITEFKGRKKTELGGWLGDLNESRKGQKPFLLKDFEIIYKSKVIYPNEFAYKNIILTFKKLSELPWVKDIVIIVGGDSNFRFDVYPDYKKNRGQKPLKLIEIKDWFINTYKGNIIVSDNCEADDELSIIGWRAFNNNKDNIVLGGIDKDLLQIPGKHYNYDKDTITNIDEFTAHYKLCIQTITGDSTDNIKSVPSANDCIQNRYPIGIGGIGPVKAKRILEGCDSIESLYKEVEEVYKCFYLDDYKKYLNLTYKLVHLLEKKGEIKDFPFSE